MAGKEGLVLFIDKGSDEKKFDFDVIYDPKSPKISAYNKGLEVLAKTFEGSVEYKDACATITKKGGKPILKFENQKGIYTLNHVEGVTNVIEGLIMVHLVNDRLNTDQFPKDQRVVAELNFSNGEKLQYPRDYDQMMSMKMNRGGIPKE
jgi:hypothetical protein